MYLDRSDTGPGRVPSGPSYVGEDLVLHATLASRARLVALVTVVLLGTAGCSGSGSSSASTTPSGGSTTSGDGGVPAAVQTKVSIGKVSGIAKKPARKKFRTAVPALEKRVGKAVDAWFDGAYVGVGYPTDSFPDAFRTFTSQAAADARKQGTLMTNAALGPDISGVTAVKRDVTLDVLAPGGTVAATTARVRLVFDTSGDKKKKVTVSGSLFLTRDPHGTWRIFGFDVSKGAGR